MGMNSVALHNEYYTHQSLPLPRHLQYKISPQKIQARAPIHHTKVIDRPHRNTTTAPLLSARRADARYWQPALTEYRLPTLRGRSQDGFLLWLFVLLFLHIL